MFKITKNIFLNMLIFFVFLSLLFSCDNHNHLQRDTKAPLIKADEALCLNDDALLDEIEFRIFNYFWNEIYPETGIAYDHSQNKIGKVAATGFELAAVCMGVERGWISHEDGYQRCLLILNTFWDDPADPDDIFVDGQYGLFWHFVNGQTGKKIPIDCVAMCDSADLIAGVLIAGEYFKGTEIEDLANKIYNKVEWDKFVKYDKDNKPQLLSFGWVPPETSESYYHVDGLLPFDMTLLADNSFLIYALALGSDTHPIPQGTWQAYINTYSQGEYGGYKCHMTGALFNRQVPFSFIDPRRKRDENIDYYQDTINAILADCVFNQKENKYPSWAWGLSDCFGKNSYSHAAPPGYISNDGTIATNAFVCSLPFLPQMSLRAIRESMKYYKDGYWGMYGLPSSYNLNTDYISPFYVGIETGPMLNMIENYRRGTIWRLFMQTKAMKNFVERAGLFLVIDDFELPPQAPAYALWQINRGSFEIAASDAQNGDKCLLIETDVNKEITLKAQLSENDIFEYNYLNYISLWARDLEVKSLSIKTNSFFPLKLESSGVISSGNWQHYYFKLPESINNKKFRELIIKVQVTGKYPALDNITCQPQAITHLPHKINLIEAKAGSIGKTITLTWQTPETKNTGAYILYISPQPFKSWPDYKNARIIEYPYEPETESKITKLILLDDDKTYFFNLRFRDKWGHLGPPSDTLTSKCNPAPYRPVLYDFASPDISGWRASNSSWILSLESLGNDSKDNDQVLKIRYNKTSNPWDYIEIDVNNPQLLTINRYLVIKVKGKAKILAKLYIDDENQQDIEIAEAKNDGWNILVFDMEMATLLKNRMDEVTKILLFIEPGSLNVEGTLYIDEVKFTN
jgi:hypothetical protein